LLSFGDLSSSFQSYASSSSSLEAGDVDVAQHVGESGFEVYIDRISK
jgi:hypothetical protein